MRNSLLQSFAPQIAALPERTTYTQEELLKPQFLLGKQNQLRVYYAPFDAVNRSARIAIVGIIPGWQQMEIAFRVARRELTYGSSAEEASRCAKIAASFAGSMRRNLIAMLDELFASNHSLVHTTSAFRYPVFKERQNYTGQNPSALGSTLLMGYARDCLVEELQQLDRALVVPLGKAVSAILRILTSEGRMRPLPCLWGFPHPSGANGHRKVEFAANKARLRKTVAQLFAR
jgi:hypothetical protein